MSRLRVQRASKRDIKIRDLYVSLDGGPEKTMLFDSSVELDIEPGEHRLTATNRLYSKTVEFSVGKSETASFEVSNVVTGCFSVMFAVFGIGPYHVEITRVDRP